MASERQWPGAPGPTATLREKLTYIAKLEVEHGFLGVRVAAKGDPKDLRTEDLVDHIIGVLHATIELKERHEAGEVPCI